MPEQSSPESGEEREEGRPPNRAERRAARRRLRLPGRVKNSTPPRLARYLTLDRTPSHRRRRTGDRYKGRNDGWLFDE